MANYIKATDFSSKDNLLTGDPLKIVSGTEIDNEFNAIQTAVNTKSNINSPTFTGTPSAPTATAGTNTTQIATTAFVATANSTLQTLLTAAIQALYPVGSIYANATDSTNPATLFGFGTWVRFGQGRVLVSQDDSNTLFNTAEETGGSYDSVVVSHTHNITDPGHVHAPPVGLNSPYISNVLGFDGSIDTSQTASPNDRTTVTGNSASATTGITINSAGESGTNKNIQPYITVYYWKRTA